MTEKFNISYISYLVVTVLGCTASIQIYSETTSPQYTEFDPAFVYQNGDKKGTVDISRFYYENSALPGNYYVDIYINEDRRSKYNIRFEEDPENKQRLCFNNPLIFSLKLDKILCS